MTVTWGSLKADWLILDPIVFPTNQISLSQIFALLFEINCTEISQSQPTIVFPTNQISLLQIFALLLHNFELLLQNFALLFEINCTEINQSQSSNIFMYIIHVTKSD